MATILRKFQPRMWDPDSQAEVEAEYLHVTVDPNDDGSVEIPVLLYFSDYAGLEAEWDAGVATTVLEGAVETHLGLTGGSASGGSRDNPDDYVPGSI